MWILVLGKVDNYEKKKKEGFLVDLTKNVQNMMWMLSLGLEHKFLTWSEEGQFWVFILDGLSLVTNFTRQWSIN